jgi:hypothetical protein
LGCTNKTKADLFGFHLPGHDSKDGVLKAPKGLLIPRKEHNTSVLIQEKEGLRIRIHATGGNQEREQPANLILPYLALRH